MWGNRVTGEGALIMDSSRPAHYYISGGRKGVACRFGPVPLILHQGEKTPKTVLTYYPPIWIVGGRGGGSTRNMRLLEEKTSRKQMTCFCFIVLSFLRANFIGKVSMF